MQAASCTWDFAYCWPDFLLACSLTWLRWDGGWGLWRRGWRVEFFLKFFSWDCYGPCLLSASQALTWQVDDGCLDKVDPLPATVASCHCSRSVDRERAVGHSEPISPLGVWGLWRAGRQIRQGRQAGELVSSSKQRTPLHLHPYGRAARQRQQANVT
eukprot:363836-Chlamydomonas_euryale.AAC.5